MKTYISCPDTEGSINGVETQHIPNEKDDDNCAVCREGAVDSILGSTGHSPSLLFKPWVSCECRLLL
jgi:hypothetical protein